MATKKAKEMTARLRRLIDEFNGQTEFCRKVWPRYAATNKAKVSKWYKGTTGIRADEAATVALACGYRPAWLLWGELPERGDVTRTDAELAEDLASYVASKSLEKVDLLARDPGLAEQIKTMIQSRGDALLQLVVDHVADEAHANAEFFRDRIKAVENLLNINDALSGPTPDVQRATYYAHRLATMSLGVPQGKVLRWPGNSVSIRLGQPLPESATEEPQDKPTGRKS